MNHTSSRRGSVLRAILLCFVVSLLGTAVVSQGDAAPANGTIKSRVTGQRQHCELDGGQLQVKNEYKVNGPFKTVVKSTTTCIGGKSDGYTCVNTKNTTECTRARTEATVPAWKIVDGPLVPITADEPFASPQDFQPFDIVASPLPVDGG
jgi:hypothetical protein